MLSGVIALAVGTVLLVAGEFWGHTALRIVAATLLVAGAIALGIARAAFEHAAFSDGRKPLLRALACFIAVLLSAPPLLLLLAALTAAIRQYSAAAEPASIAAGGAIALLLLVILIAALVIGVLALCSQAEAHGDRA